MTKLIQAKETHGLTNKQIRDEVVTLLFAGYDTTSNTLSFCTYFLAKYPSVLNKVRHEVNENIKNDTPTLEEIKSCVFLHAVILESMRLLPPVPGVQRMAIEDDSIEGYFIPKDKTIGVLISHLNLDPRSFKDPLEFRPERFLNSNKQDHFQMGFFPFTEGPRKCIGKEMSLVEAALILAMFIKSFDFELIKGFKPDILLRITSSFKNPLKLSIKPTR